MNNKAEYIKKYLESKAVAYEMVEMEDSVVIRFHSKVPFSIFYLYEKTLLLRGDGLTIFTTTPYVIDEEALPRFYEAINRINTGYLNSGHFEVLESGHFRHVIHIELVDEVDDRRIEKALFVGTKQFVRYEDIVFCILEGTVAPDKITEFESIYTDISEEKQLSKRLTEGSI